MSANPQETFGAQPADPDAQETREWTDALSAVIQSEGPERAHFLLEQLLEHARQNSIDKPFSANTAYVNTIEPWSYRLVRFTGEHVRRRLQPFLACRKRKPRR